MWVGPGREVLSLKVGVSREERGEGGGRARVSAKMCRGSLENVGPASKSEQAPKPVAEINFLPV